MFSQQDVDEKSVDVALTRSFDIKIVRGDFRSK